MIWLKKHRLVFVKIPKNASEAIAAYLQTYAEPDDVFTLDNGFYANIDEPHRTHAHMDMKYVLENRLADCNNTFLGVVRNPYERLLSLYLYRHRQRRYDTALSVDDFRLKAKGGYIQDHPWHMQLQSTFLNGTNGMYICYDNLRYHIQLIARDCGFAKDILPVVNKSVNGLNTRDLVDIFYDDVTRKAVHKYWQSDFDLYNEIRNAETRLDK